MIAHPNALALTTLKEVVTDFTFVTRLGMLATRTQYDGKETAFALSTHGTHRQYAEYIIPHGRSDNDGLDPREGLSVTATLREMRTFSRFLALLIHSHPETRYASHDLVRCPSMDDLELHIRVHNEWPGHIGGISLFDERLVPVHDLMLYKIPDGPNSIAQLLGNEIQEAQVESKRTAAMQAAGWLTARLKISPTGQVYGIENLAALFPGQKN